MHGVRNAKLNNRIFKQMLLIQWLLLNLWFIKFCSSFKYTFMLYIRNTIGLLLLTFLTFSLAAQKTDCMILKNGTKLYGEIQQSNSQKRLTIASGDQNWTFDVTEIDTVMYNHKKKFGISYKSYVFSAGIGNYYSMFANNHGYQNLQFFNLKIDNNYMFGNRVSVGFTSGLEKQFYHILVPTVANVKYDILRHRLTPYLTLKAGYNHGIYPEQDFNFYKLSYDGGYVWGAALGFKNYFNPSTAFFIEMGFQRQRLSYTNEYENHTYTTVYEFTSFGFHLGLEFR